MFQSSLWPNIWIVPELTGKLPLLPTIVPTESVPNLVLKWLSLGICQLLTKLFSALDSPSGKPKKTGRNSTSCSRTIKTLQLLEGSSPTVLKRWAPNTKTKMSWGDKCKRSSVLEAKSVSKGPRSPNLELQAQSSPTRTAPPKYQFPRNSELLGRPHIKFRRGKDLSRAVIVRRKTSNRLEAVELLRVT